jgi:hypothetical protein
VPHPEGRLVRTDSFVVHDVQVSAADTSGVFSRIMAQAGSLSPTYVVNDAGELVRIVDAPRLKEIVDSTLLPIRRELGPLPPESAPMIAGLTSGRALTAAVGSLNSGTDFL